MDTPSKEVRIPDVTASMMPVKNADEYSADVMAQAYALYLGGHDTTAISMDTSVPVPVVRKWISDGKWVAKRKALEEDAITLVENEFRTWAVKTKLPEAQKHLELARSLQEAIRTKLDADKALGPLSDMSLKRLSEALASVTAVSARAVQLSDKPPIQYNPAGGGGQGGKPVLVILGAASHVSMPSRAEEGQVIDVD